MAQSNAHAPDAGSLLAKRDGLLRQLRRDGVGGVRAAGLTRTGDVEHLLLLVAPGLGASMPTDFEGVPVTIRETGVAKA